ncbi:16S rRNA (cytosine(1402)-N(4))-methyltransferase RsmH [bacterium]|nr:16S rRNA (cytosine(1402)-N(4))-methyltransferase RsmH [bacterium]
MWQKRNLEWLSQNAVITFRYQSGSSKINERGQYKLGVNSHVPVLLEQFLEMGFPANGEVFVDGTYGFGGHSQALLERFPSIKVCIAFDQDTEVIKLTEGVSKNQRIKLFHSRASLMGEVLSDLKISGIDGFLLDLGVSSHQLDTPGRGFSFRLSGPLDMRMDPANSLTAADIVNTWSEDRLVGIFFSFGEERFSKRIAREIVAQRKIKAFETTEELALLVTKSIPSRFKRVSIHPATKVFQALRIAVNNELDELSIALKEGLSYLKPNGRISVISFHSLEDRIVKNFFSAASKGCVCPPKFPICVCHRKPEIEVLTRKPISPDIREISRNPRSRSAKLRVGKRLPNDF